MSVRMITVPLCHCERCGHDWIPISARKDPAKLPLRCGSSKCMTPYWNVQKKSVDELAG